MASAEPPRVLLCSDAQAGEDEVRALLQQGGFQVVLGHPPDTLPGELGQFGMVLVESSSADRAALAWCRELRRRQGESYVPILFISADASPAQRLASLESGADTYLLRPFAPAELLAQVQALVRIKERHDQLTAKSAEVNRVNKRLQTAYQQLDQELELARRIQESFLPRKLPELPQVRFAVHYRPCGRVGGDFYDVFRLDEKHLGFYVADAMGHGVPASLLTIFVKTGVWAKEINGKDYRLVPPGEVLQRLNRELIKQALPDHPFITMIYALYNFVDGTFCFSRAGHPYPLFVPREGAARVWPIEGSLLGVFETDYFLQSQLLQPGDKVVLYTDGMDAAAFQSEPVGLASILAAANQFRDLPVEELVVHLGRDLFGQSEQTDDVTILGIQRLDG